MHEHIFGIVPPMTTPFRADDSIDDKVLRADTRYLVETAPRPRARGAWEHGRGACSHRRRGAPHHGDRHRRGEGSLRSDLALDEVLKSAHTGSVATTR